MPDTQPKPHAEQWSDGYPPPIRDLHAVPIDQSTRAILDAVDSEQPDADPEWDVKRLAFAYLDALDVLSPDAVADWFAEHHPQPEREPDTERIARLADTLTRADTEHQRDSIAHAYATGCHDTNPDTDYADEYDFAIKNADGIPDIYPKHHAAARARHATQQPEPEPVCSAGHTLYEPCVVGASGKCARLSHSHG